MKAPVYNPDWSDSVKALYAHDMQEMWDRTLLPNIYNCYHSELSRYLGMTGDSALRVLDVGCAQGTLALLLGEAGHAVTAVDLRQEFLDYARSRWEFGSVRFVQANAMELDLPERFDLIFANQILEHLVHPVALIARLARMLVPGGRLVVTTPNARYLRNSLPTFTELGDPAQHEARQFFPDGDGHFFAYSPEELRDILRRSGLMDVCVRPFDSPWITGHMKFRHLHGRAPLSLLRALDRLTLGTSWARRRLGYQLMGQGRTSP